MKKLLLLIDGSSLAYRAYYAFIKNPLKTSKGEPTSAIFGFARSLKKLSEELNPDYAAVCFDLPGPTFRDEKFQDYKAKRKETPEELVKQLPHINNLCESAGFSVISKKGYEADDIIATLAEEAEKENVETVIFTLDKDLMQLVSDNVKILNMHKSGVEWYDKAKVEEKFGVPPEKINDFLALTGDSSDNIPGVKGIGKKTAALLLEKFNSLENIFLNIEQVKNTSIKDKLMGKEKEAELWKELTRLEKHVPITEELTDLKYKGVNPKNLKNLLKYFEFYSLIEEWIGEEENSQDFNIVNLIEVKEGQSIFIYYNEDKSFISVENDVEVVEKDKLRIRFNDFEKNSFVLEDAKKFAHLIGFYPKNKVFDLSIMHYLLYPNRKNHSLSRILLEQGITPGKPESISISMKGVYERLLEELKKNDLLKVYNEIEEPLISILYEIEKQGLLIDKDLLGELKTSIEKELETIEEKIYKLAGSKFNLRSPKQLSEILFLKLKLPPVKKTKTGFSTDFEVLKALSGKHPIISELVDFRESDKLLAAYVIPLINCIDKATGRIHHEFQQSVAATGRLTTTTPNLQTLPIRTEKGRKIREAVVAPQYNQILSCDYSQIELRILAYISNDQKLINDFENNLDIHLQTACRIFGVEADQVTSEMRRKAKTMNFGIIYGISPFGLSRQLEITNTEASSIIEKYYNNHPGVERWQKETIEIAMNSGFVKTIYGRKRLIPELKSLREIEYGKRIAINTPIQGSAADIIKKAMILINRALKNKMLKTKMILQIHDELLFEVPINEKQEAIDLILPAMENAGELAKIPLKVDYNFGKNWNEAH
jgi:DNA polymerase-1